MWIHKVPKRLYKESMAVADVVEIAQNDGVSPELNLRGGGNWKSLVLKGAFSIVALGVILWKIGIGSLAHTLGGLNPWWLAGAAFFVG